MSRDREADGGGQPAPRETAAADKSFVRKVKSRVSGLLPSSLSKWFNNEESTQKVRTRSELEEDEEDSFVLQPPMKRSKPSTGQTRESLEVSFISIPEQSKQGTSRGQFRREFPEPVPGPSGVKSKKLVLPSVSLRNHYVPHNGDKDSDSGESTSGYSSMPRIGSKEQVSEMSEKQAAASANTSSNRSLFSHSYSRNDRSLFTDRSSSPNMNTSLSSRRPAFNPSAFGSPTFMDRTLSTRRIVDSPFYGGRTVYGGAASLSSKKKSADGASGFKSFIHAKPSDGSAHQKPTTLSNTAKRILSTLEQYTSPAEDIRRIPKSGLTRVNRPEGLISKYTGVNPYLVRDTRVASNKELVVPTVSDLLKMKMRGQLQESTESMRELAASSSSPLNREEYSLPNIQEQSTSKATAGKMKKKVTSVRQKAVEIETPRAPVKLPNVQLPISTLPNFDFTIPSPVTKQKTVPPKESPQKKPQTSVQPAKKVTSPTMKAPTKPPTLPFTTQQKACTKPATIKDLKPTMVEFKFSKPLVLSENKKSIKAINNFKFSEPVYKKQCSKDEQPKLNFISFTCSTFTPIKKTAVKNNGENGPVMPAKELLKSGSVMDVLGKKSDNLMAKFKPPEDTWECKTCLIRNASNKNKCAACETPKDAPAAKQPAPQQPVPQQPAQGFGDKFKISTSQWECSACMVRNDSTKSKCVACETAKPGDKPVAPLNPLFKTPSDKWECQVCLVRNDNSVDKCVACTNSKPSTVKTTTPGFGDKFKPPSSTWECSSCLVRNNEDKEKCVACEAQKPGSKALAGLFKKKDGEWECASCMVKNPDSKLNCVCCESLKPGAVAPVQSIPKFSFGVDKGQVNGHGFTFGIPKDKQAEKKDVTKADTSWFTSKAADAKPTFSFGIPNNNTRKADTDEKEIVKKPKAAPQINGDITSTENKFSFGVPKTSKTISFDMPSPTVSMGTNTSTSTSSSSTPLVSFGDVKSSASFTFNAPAKTESAPTFSLVPPKTDSASKAPETSGGFSFSKPAPATAKTESLFSFTPSKPAPANTAFANPAPMFTGTFVAPSGNFGSSMFGEAAPAAPTAPRNSVFGGNATFGAPAQPQQPVQNGVFNFGGGTASAAAPKTGFNFGSTTVPSGGFNFGASANSNTTSSSGGFQFNAPTAPPTFNFNAGSTPQSFPPTVQSSELKQRVIRKAVRRTQQR